MNNQYFWMRKDRQLEKQYHGNTVLYKPLSLEAQCLHPGVLNAALLYF